MSHKKENYEIIAEALSACLKKFEGKGFLLEDLLDALEIIVSSAVTHRVDVVEAKRNLLIFYGHTYDLVDHVYSNKDTNQKT